MGELRLLVPGTTCSNRKTEKALFMQTAMRFVDVEVCLGQVSPGPFELNLYFAGPLVLEVSTVAIVVDIFNRKKRPCRLQGKDAEVWLGEYKVCTKEKKPDACHMSIRGTSKQ